MRYTYFVCTFFDRRIFRFRYRRLVWNVCYHLSLICSRSPSPFFSFFQCIWNNFPLSSVRCSPLSIASICASLIHWERTAHRSEKSVWKPKHSSHVRIHGTAHTHTIFRLYGMVLHINNSIHFAFIFLLYALDSVRQTTLVCACIFGRTWF